MSLCLDKGGVFDNKDDILGLLSLILGDGLRSLSLVTEEGLRSLSLIVGDGLRRLSLLAGDGLRSLSLVAGEGLRSLPLVIGDGLRKEGDGDLSIDLRGLVLSGTCCFLVIGIEDETGLGRVFLVSFDVDRVVFFVEERFVVFFCGTIVGLPVGCEEDVTFFSLVSAFDAILLIIFKS